MQLRLGLSVITAVRDKSKVFQFTSESKLDRATIKSCSDNKHYGQTFIMCFVVMHKQEYVSFYSYVVSKHCFRDQRT